MNFFDRAANRIARFVGHPGTFALAFLVIVVWAVIGPFAGYSDTWQLVINTSTTIVTFLMVFLIQNTQNRDSHALHLKIDELLRALDAADTRLVDLEERSEKDLDRLHQHYVSLAAHGVAPHQVAEEADKAQRSAPQGRRGQRNQSRRRNVQKPQT
jgi:low affinity Fe/Cu permease